MICMDAMEHSKTLACGHAFCRKCIEEYFKVVEMHMIMSKLNSAKTLFLWFYWTINGWAVRYFHILVLSRNDYIGWSLHNMLPRLKICYQVGLLALVYWDVLWTDPKLQVQF